MNPPDPLDDLLGTLEPVAVPFDVQPQVERAFRNHADESKGPAALAWRAWGRWVEPVLVTLFVLIFLIWAFRDLLGG